MLSTLRSLFKRGGRRSEARRSIQSGDDLSRLHPPDDPNDVEGWDRYSVVQAQMGFAPRLYDMMIDDRDLVRVMNAEGTSHVLCAGCGVSQEPQALAEAGFQVVALDISPRAIEITQRLDLYSEAFEGFCDPDMRREGGQVEFVVGDFFDLEVCPGPFDVIIERRTAQLFAKDDLGGAMSVLANRLIPNGIFLSHCHDGGWKPPVEPNHFTKPWFEEHGWAIWNGSPGEKPSGQVAWLDISTG